MVINFKKHQAWSENLSIVMQLGLTMAGCIFFCFWIGYLLDGWLKTKGLFITIFIVLGIIGGGITVYRQIQEIVSTEDREDQNHDLEGD